MNVVESEETTTWYVEKDKSWNLAVAIWYVKMDECCWKWRNNYLMLRRIKVETKQLLFDMLKWMNVVESEGKQLFDMLWKSET